MAYLSEFAFDNVLFLSLPLIMAYLSEFAFDNGPSFCIELAFDNGFQYTVSLALSIVDEWSEK